MYKRVKKGYYSAKYFFKTKKIIEKYKPKSIVTIQFFQSKDNVVLCGINEVLKILKNTTETSKYSIKYLKEGSIIHSKDVVLELEGNYKHFGLLEGIIDGILARQTSIATNAKQLIKSTNKKIIFMGDRSDAYINQENDGHAVFVGGIKNHVTNAQAKKNKANVIGTMPHALIQMFKGDLISALTAYNKTFPEEDLVALVDFNNDVINDSLKVLNAFGKKIKAIRIDTSNNVSDSYFKNNEEYGVTPNLIFATRKALDQNGGKHVKIIVSSGFDLNKIMQFEILKTPVDIYGVGRSLLKINHIFTADAVKINGKLLAKYGRKYNENKKMVKF